MTTSNTPPAAAAGDRPITVCVDAMGGDFAPARIVEGSILALNELASPPRIALVGNQGAIVDELHRAGVSEDRFEIVHAPEAVGMGEKAANSVRRKKNSSLAVASRMMKNGEADALVSAGNTGAVVSTALLGLGRVEGVSRPAIASVVPTPHGHVVILDVGATTDAKPEYLVQFAIMGMLYAESCLHIEQPRVGLLNIGEEPGKGNELARATYDALSEAPVRFVGNVEGGDVVKDIADVIVCDGFVGNIVLKFAESLVEALAHMFRDSIRNDVRAKVGAVLARPAVRRTFRKLDYAEYGGAPLLGVRGGCIICHGRSSAVAIKNAIRVAAEFVEADINGKIVDRLHRGQAHG
jgi:glycerol-3-phosphate acyltransferase PlsX